MVNFYKNLARRYRPSRFSDLIGQDVLVQILRSAIEHHRLSSAYIFHGIRGVGKTTTARLLACALNCLDYDAIEGDSCGMCESCVAIAGDRHVDVMEMDAASHTGVNDVREILENVQYRPLMGPFKIYILDEVHMLSISAFNALLKTLEDPPDHVKFIFATTEMGKVPATVLSRCQQFDLHRVDHDVLRAHFKNILSKEGFSIEERALHIIVQACEGSVRDGLSMLDQALVLAVDGCIEAHSVDKMLGNMDQAFIIDYFYEICHADAQAKVGEVLQELEKAYRNGSDPVLILQDLVGFTYQLTRLKCFVEDKKNFMHVSEDLCKKIDVLVARLSFPVLSRIWQVLVKGLEELKYVPNVRQGVEMILLRLMYMGNVEFLEHVEQSSEFFEALSEDSLLEQVKKVFKNAVSYKKGESNEY